MVPMRRQSGWRPFPEPLGLKGFALGVPRKQKEVAKIHLSHSVIQQTQDFSLKSNPESSAGAFKKKRKKDHCGRLQVLS